MASYRNTPEGLTKRIELCVRAKFDGSWSEFGRAAGVPPSTLKNIARGGDPRSKTLLAIARALGVSIDWLVAGEPLDHVEPRSLPAAESDPAQWDAEAKDAGGHERVDYPGAPLVPKLRGHTRHRQISDARAKAWQSMRILRAFTIPQLSMTAGIAEGNAFVFTRRLVRAGYLRVVKEREINRPGSRTVYALTRDTGPRHPIPWNSGEVFDQNLQEVVNG